MLTKMRCFDSILLDFNLTKGAVVALGRDGLDFPPRMVKKSVNRGK
jgi:hypothetical protein